MKSKILKTNLLIIYSVLIVPFMIAAFGLLTRLLGKTTGYAIAYSIYLVILLCGIRIFGKSEEGDENTGIVNSLFYDAFAFLPVLATFFVAFLPVAEALTLFAISIAAIYAIANSIIEELFWRYTFNKNFRKNFILAFLLPATIFSSWHIALLFANGMSYHGGALALVGGASFMGFLWGFVYYKTQNIRVVIAAHMFSNFFAFSQLIHQNWFLK